MASGDYGQVFQKKIRVLDWLRSERIRRTQHLQFAARRAVLRALAASEASTPALRARTQLGLSRLPTAAAPSRLVSRCHNSGRTRFVIGRAGLARMAFRRYATLGKLPGLVRRTW